MWNQAILHLPLTTWAAVILGGLLWMILVSFVFWKTYRAEHEEKEIFDLVLGMFFFGVVFAAVGSFLWQTIGALGLGLLVVNFVWVRKHDWESGILMDVSGVLGLFLVALAYLFQGIWVWGGIYFAALVTCAYILAEYRNFSWYKTGRPGLAGVIAFISIAFGQIAVAIVLPHGIYWLGISSSQIAAVALLVSYVILLILKPQWTKKIKIWSKRKLPKRVQV